VTNQQEPGKGIQVQRGFYRVQRPICANAA
jgi:hypothetical protein